MYVFLLKFDIFPFYSFLFHTISFSDGYGTVFNALMVDGDTVWCPYFILSTISFSDSSSVIIFAFIVLA